MRRRMALLVALAMLAMASAPGASAVDSLSDSANGSGLTQTHTLYYNVKACAAHGNTLQYAIVNWKTRFQRTAGADRDLDTVRYRIDVNGFLCTGASSPHSTGVLTYHPGFGTKNDVTWTAALNWPYLLIAADGSWSGSSHRAYYTRRGGGPWVTSLCNNVIFTNGDKCSSL